MLAIYLRIADLRLAGMFIIQAGLIAFAFSVFRTFRPPASKSRNDGKTTIIWKTTSHVSPDVSILTLFSPSLRETSLASSGAKFFGSESVSCAPEAWKPSLMSVTTNTGWSSGLVEDVALQVISSFYSNVNICFIIRNNAVYVDHRHSGKGMWVV